MCTYISVVSDKTLNVFLRSSSNHTFLCTSNAVADFWQQLSMFVSHFTPWCSPGRFQHNMKSNLASVETFGRLLIATQPSRRNKFGRLEVTNSSGSVSFKLRLKLTWVLACVGRAATPPSSGALKKTVVQPKKQSSTAQRRGLFCLVAHRSSQPLSPPSVSENAGERWEAKVVRSTRPYVSM